MKPPTKINRRTRRFLSGCCFVAVGILVVVLLGVLPIGWILSPSSAYFPVSGDATGQETILNVVQSVVGQSQVTDKPVSMAVDIYADAAIGVFLWEHIFKGKSDLFG